MPEKNKLQRLQAHADEARASFKSFARIQDELRNLAKLAPPGPERKRLEGLVALNEKTLNAVAGNLRLAQTQVDQARSASEPPFPKGKRK